MPMSSSMNECSVWFEQMFAHSQTSSSSSASRVLKQKKEGITDEKNWIKTGNFHYLPRGRRCLFDYDYDFLPLLLIFRWCFCCYYTIYKRKQKRHSCHCWYHWMRKNNTWFVYLFLLRIASSYIWWLQLLHIYILYYDVLVLYFFHFHFFS